MGMDDLDGQGSTGYDGGTEQGNPAWKPFFDALPQDLHPTITPILSEWDKGVTARFDKVHSEYAPFKEFKDAGISPEDLRFGIGLWNALNEDPKGIWEALGTNYGFNGTGSSGQGQGQPNDSVDANNPQNEALQQYEALKKQTDILTQVILQQKQQEEITAKNAEADRKLAQELSDLTKKYGKFDEEPVLRLLASNTFESAVDAYNYVQRLVGNSSPKPIFAPGGGGVPGQYSTNPSKLSEAGLKDLTVQYLQNYKQQRQG